MVNSTFSSIRILLPVFTAIVASTRAATLNIDPSHSQVTLSGKVAGYVLTEQEAGSLTSTVAGTVDVTTAGGQIQITAATLAPNINGNWAPGTNNQASSPADFGGKASTAFGSITGALRNLLVNASSSPTTLQPNGQFSASSIVFSFPSNSKSVLDYTSFITGPGSKQLAGNGTNQTATVGSLTNQNGGRVLTISLDTTFFFTFLTANDTALTLKGQLVANEAPVIVIDPPPAMVTGARVVKGNFQFIGTDVSDSTQVESSKTLINWGPQAAHIRTNDTSSRTYSVPANEESQFFRLLQ